jgi:hypothetical protein
VVLSPVDKELTLVDVVVDSEVNWLKLTASVGLTPAATLVSVTGVVEPTPPSVTFVWVESSYWTEFASPVDSEATLLLVVLRPVDSDVMPVEVEVDSEARPLLVVLRPVDNEVTPLWAVLIPVEVEVDSEAKPLFVVLSPVEVDVDNEAT